MVSQSQRRQNTRQKIIDAAKVLFSAHGFEETTLDQLIEGSGVARRTFYKHFNSKVDLLVASSRDGGAEKVSALIESVEQGSDALDALERYYLALAEWLENNEKIAEAIIVSGIKQHNEKEFDPSRVAHDFTKLMVRHAQSQGKIRKDISPDTLATQVGGAFSICVIRWSKDPSPRALVNETKLVLILFLEGAKQ
jgi:AcrR family transcriptional regulator